jgi:hypothetical protein
MKNKIFEWIALFVYLAIIYGLYWLISNLYPSTTDHTTESFYFLKTKIVLIMGIIFFGIASIFMVWNIFRK